MVYIALLYTAAASVVAILAYFLYTGYQHRSKMNALRIQGIPMPDGWSWWTGHLMVIQKHLRRIPKNASVTLALREISYEFTESELFILDLWPIQDSMIFLFGPESIVQVSNKMNLPKPALMSELMKPITGGPSLLTMNGHEWKYWRNIFNPGFSSAAMENNVADIVDSVTTFREKLIANIGKGFFSLDNLTMRLTTEIILKVVLNHDSNYQQTSYSLIEFLQSILRWHSFWDPIILYNPLRFFIQYYHSYFTDKELTKIIYQRFEDLKAESSVNQKSVVSPALKEYLGTSSRANEKMDEKLNTSFSAFASCQVRLFLFAGTDTTASTMVYVFYTLSKHNDWLCKIREEHSQVFGPNLAEAAKLLKETPSLLSKCQLTLAVIKETLRLFPPAGSVRSNQPGAIITDRKGNQHSLDYLHTTISHHCLHYNQRFWPRPTEFLPERFLVGPESELYPHPAAYRPFEQGPRNPQRWLKVQLRCNVRSLIATNNRA